MPRNDLSAYLEDGKEVLEGVASRKFPDGKDYTFLSPSFEVGLHLTRMFELAVKARTGGELSPEDADGLVLDDDQERDVYRQVMGATFEEMKADGVPWTSVQAIFRLLFGKWAANRDIAEQLSSSGEAPARPNRASRRATPKKTAGGKSRRASGGSANPTPPADSPDSSTSPTGSEGTAEAV